MRFTILYHQVASDARRSNHWDLLLQSDEMPFAPDSACLLCFELLVPPAQWEHLEARALAKHRGLYLDYEGVLTEGRGSVEQVLTGEIVWLSRSPKELRFQTITEKLPCPESWGPSNCWSMIPIAEREDYWQLSRLRP
jgi:hypothetical protein